MQRLTPAIPSSNLRIGDPVAKSIVGYNRRLDKAIESSYECPKCVGNKTCPDCGGIGCTLDDRNGYCADGVFFCGVCNKKPLATGRDILDFFGEDELMRIYKPQESVVVDEQSTFLSLLGEVG